jgi:DNA-binding CsgD family transcriptional regulator
MASTDPLTAGLEALKRGAWQEARTAFNASLEATESPQALEHLGLASWWLDDTEQTFRSRERAYALYRDQGDAKGAARVALWLVWDHLAIRGDSAVAAGWLERARRLLAGHESSAEFGWLLLREGEVALFRGHDPVTARTSGMRAAELGRQTGDRGIEFTGLALEGLARVSAGDVAAGMRCLDEATAAATGGEVKELHTVGVVCCWQIFACERVRDFDRAAQWCARVQEFTRRWRFRPLSAICRVQYAGVLIWRGAWAEAETELAEAVRDFEQSRPPLIGQAFARLGELRLRQGRWDDAGKLFEQAGSQPIARLGQVALALERGDAAGAAADVDRYLVQTGTGEPTLRAGALELAVRAHAALKEWTAAEQARDELQRIAQALGTLPLALSVAAAEGDLQRSHGDAVGAARHFEEAAVLAERTGAPLEMARARLELSRTLAAQGQRAGAEREARRALETFQTLGAARDTTRATDLLTRLAESPGSSAKPKLTARQLEILRLVAEGLSNPEIAVRLRLSDHTVKRHVANLLTRLGLPSRAAAVAYAAQHGLL